MELMSRGCEDELGGTGALSFPVAGVSIRGVDLSGCALPFLDRHSYSRTILEVQNLRAERCHFWSAGPSELQPCGTGGAKPLG